MSKFLWHSLSADHEIDGLISDVIGHTVNTGTKKRDLLMPILGGNLTGTSGSLQQNTKSCFCSRLSFFLLLGSYITTLLCSIRNALSLNIVVAP